jgi:hypothetical protein
MVISCCLSPPLNFDDRLPTPPVSPLIDATNSPYVKFLKDKAIIQSKTCLTVSYFQRGYFRLLPLHTRNIMQPVINPFTPNDL